jgi:hypothetical protein
VNAGTVGVSADFCVRASGSSSWGTPILAGGGNENICQSGLAYGEATVPFSVQAGALDIKAIPAGSPCTAAATSERDGASVGSSASGAPVVTVLRVAGGSSPEILVALAEESVPQPNVDALRIVNALATGAPINVGLVPSATLPATVQANAFASAIAPASVEPAGSSSLGTIDADGYLTLIPASLNIGVTVSGSTSAVLVVTTPTTPDRQTLFAIGDASDPAHPFHALYCEDVVVASSSPDGGTGAGAPALLATCAE